METAEPTSTDLLNYYPNDFVDAAAAKSKYKSKSEFKSKYYEIWSLI